MTSRVIELTLPSGRILRIRKENIIAAHEALPAEMTPSSEDPSPGETKIYLSNGITLYVRESPEESVIP